LHQFVEHKIKPPAVEVMFKLYKGIFMCNMNAE